MPTWPGPRPTRAHPAVSGATKSPAAGLRIARSQLGLAGSPHAVLCANLAPEPVPEHSQEAPAGMSLCGDTANSASEGRGWRPRDGMWSRERDTPKRGSRGGSGGSSPRRLGSASARAPLSTAALAKPSRDCELWQAAGMKAQGTASCPWEYS